jgi:PAS domain S-box-containing protein
MKLRDLPIQRKMLVMTLLICGAVLCVAIAALFTFQVLNFRSNFQRDTAALADVIANNSAAPITFQDDLAATEVVGALKAKPSVLAACLVLPNRSVFAHYGKAEDSRTLAEFPPAGQFRFVGGQLLVAQPVKLKREHIGTLYLRSDYRRTFLQLLGFYGQVVSGVMIASIILGVFLSRRLGGAITRPVLELARTTRIIGEKTDYSVRARVDDRRDELGQLAESFNEMLGRLQKQDAALNLSQQKMEALIHSIDGIVWERKPNSFQFTFISRQSETMLGYAPQAWLDNSNFWQSKLHPQDAAKAVQTGSEVAARGLPYHFEYRLLATDGRVVWIRESGTVLVEKGQPVALRGIFHNITQQKHDAAELDKLNRQLIDTSRSAGMADVATGVLHNVGNVLNSVVVSTTLIRDRLRRSKITNLSRATAMIRGQNGHLVDFLTTDPKGKLLPEYLCTVADQLNSEQSELISEMDSVGQHVEHIKEIVAMQQNYAKVSGAYENISPVDLVEDALRLNIAALERHRVEVVREFDSNLPKVNVDRHKFLQIFINLLRNAKHAMEHIEEHPRIMTISMAMTTPERVKIVVKDNGIGIPPENLKKIFNHGFTTKKDGHGFGLHSGANAAKEMGGCLTALSDGPGRGAEFILELPTNRQKTDNTEMRTRSCTPTN